MFVFEIYFENFVKRFDAWFEQTENGLSAIAFHEALLFQTKKDLIWEKRIEQPCEIKPWNILACTVFTFYKSC